MSCGSNNDRNQALGMLRAGISTREVARLFNCHQSTVVSNHEQCVRSSSARTTDQQDRHIQIQHLV